MTALDGFFSEQEIDTILEHVKQFQTKRASVLGEGGSIVDSDDIRRSSVLMISRRDPEAVELFKMIDSLVHYINSEYYQFDLSYGFDGVQYAEYHGETSDKYDFHCDFIWGEQMRDPRDVRKLSISLVLSSPSEFEGGDFEYVPGSAARYKVEQQKGRVLAFPSWVIHRVTPVTKGIRRSLVLWARGPRLK